MAFNGGWVGSSCLMNERCQGDKLTADEKRFSKNQGERSGSVLTCQSCGWPWVCGQDLNLRGRSCGRSQGCWPHLLFTHQAATKPQRSVRFGFGPSFYRLEIMVLGNQQSMRHTMTVLVTKSSAYPQFLSLYVDDLIVLNSIKAMYPAVILSTKARGIGLDVSRNF